MNNKRNYFCDTSRNVEAGQINDFSVEVDFIDVEIGESVFENRVETFQLGIHELGDADVDLEGSVLVRVSGTFSQKLYKIFRHFVNLFAFVLRKVDANRTGLSPRGLMDMAISFYNNIRKDKL